MIFTNDLLVALGDDAADQIIIDVPCIWHRFYLATQSKVSVYRLPDFVRGVQRITWRGRKLDEMSWEEMQLLPPATVIIGPGIKDNIEAGAGEPLYYALHPTNILDIRLYPPPAIAFSDVGGDPFSPAIENRCIVTCWRTPEEYSFKFSLPPYIDRRTRKAYVLWRAFGAEGKGQTLKISQYYLQKYNFLINRFRAINEGCFISKRYALDDGVYTSEGYRYPKPTLNPNFERVYFR